MRVTLGGTRQVTLDKSMVIGRGGEAVIYRDPDHPNSKAIKVYHQTDLRRAQKLQFLLNHRLALPNHVLAPLELAEAPMGNIVGFGMRQLSRRYSPLKEIFSPSFCADNEITTRVAAEMLLGVGEDLNTLHPHHIRVGDLNDGGIMLHQQNHDVAWVDVDSWDVDGFPCMVGTQLYLCPDLYGRNLEYGAHFQPWHDWWSYSVLLFRALLRKHPFKAGMHRQYVTVLDRAQHGVTVLDRGVDYPDVGLKPEVLSDDLTESLLQHLKRKTKGPFPLNVLRTYVESLVPCRSCGVWYPATRANCPQCAERTVVDIRHLLGISVVEFIETQGRILHTQLDLDALVCVAEEFGNLVVYQRDRGGNVRKTEIGLQYHSRMKFGVFSDHLVISVDEDENDYNGALYILDMSGGNITPVKQTTTGIFAGQGPVFATSRRCLYRSAKNVILCGERFAANGIVERPVTQVSEGQTWFSCHQATAKEQEVLFGFNREVDQMHWFLSVGERSFTTARVLVSELRRRESLLDLSVRFSEKALLLMRRTRYRGADYVYLDRVEIPSGVVLSNEVLEISTHPHWDSIRGKAYVGNTVMHALDSGILKENLDTHQTQALPGSAQVASAEDSLLPYGGGVLVVKHNKVLFVTK